MAKFLYVGGIDMFQFLKKNVDLYAPVVGQSVSLEEVPDKMFSKKLMGDGIAFVYDTDTIYAPCDCEVIMIADTKHALGLRTANKAEIMIHIGLDTVNLNGEGFHLLVNPKDKVKRGQALVKLDRAFFEKKGVHLITPMIITSTEFQLQINAPGEVSLESCVLSIL